MPTEQACGNSHKCFYQNGVEFINHARLRRSHVGKASRSMARPTNSSAVQGSNALLGRLGCLGRKWTGQKGKSDAIVSSARTSKLAAGSSSVGSVADQVRWSVRRVVRGGIRGPNPRVDQHPLLKFQHQDPILGAKFDRGVYLKALVTGMHCKIRVSCYQSVHRAFCLAKLQIFIDCKNGSPRLRSLFSCGQAIPSRDTPGSEEQRQNTENQDFVARRHHDARMIVSLADLACTMTPT